ncbi:MAG TPA: Fic family protein [Pirellulales bacterium]
MDKSKFSDACPGRLVAIEKENKAKDWAFVPAPLPPDWEFDIGLWPLLAEAREALGTLNGIGQTLPNPQLLLRPLQTREAITSSSIEGTHVTAAQLLLYELDPIEPTSREGRVAEWQEVFNHTRALERGLTLLGELPFCNRLFKEVHAVLMDGVRGYDKSPGQFRNMQVQIGSRGRFIPPPASEVARLMDNFEHYINSDHPRLDPLVRCYLVHYQFEAIHPFRDGNGRLGRVLLTLMISRRMHHSMPWLYLSAFFERYRDEYVSNLFAVSTKAHWSQWIEFCLRGTIEQANDSIRRCHEFKRLRETYYEQIRSRGPSPRSHQIIDVLFTYPVLTIPAIVKKFGVSYPTARSDLELLVACGILNDNPKVHPRTFQAPQVMRIAFSDHLTDPELVEPQP